MQNDTITFDAMAGADINETIAETIAMSADNEDRPVQFNFNGVTVTVRSDSDPKLIYRDWSRSLSGYIEKNVDPYPNAELSDEERASDARIEAQNEQRRKDATEKAQKAQRQQELVLEGALSVAPEMKFKDEAGWKEAVEKNSKDPYSNGVIRFAERWARLMQSQMDNGASLDVCADEASRVADTEGITGFMYGCAVSILSQVWEHGEELRRWHNVKTQIGNEGEQANESGGVLNPALLTIGTK